MQIKHKYISNQIEKDIMDGVYDHTSKLPTEDQLIEKYNVSRNTIRKAITTLVQKGIVMAIQGSGMFIRQKYTEGYLILENFRGLTQDVNRKSLHNQIIKFERMEADEKIAGIMNCEVGTPLYFVNRLRIVDGKKFVVEYSYYNKLIIPYLNEDIISGSIYQYIQNDLLLEIGYADRIIRAEKLDAVNASLLGLQENDPVLITENLAMLKNGSVFDYSIDYYHYEHTKFLKLSNTL